MWKSQQLSRFLDLLFSGANSIFYGDKLLTTPNPGTDEDLDLLRVAGLKGEISSAAASS